MLQQQISTRGEIV